MQPALKLWRRPLIGAQWLFLRAGPGAPNHFEGGGVARTILTQPAMDPFNAGELSPGPAVATDEEILEWVRRDGETALHPSCTCAMGTGPQAVTDPATMRVHGLDGLRVVDASAMPYITNGNIYAPVMMMAEKSADLILGATPLPPSEAAVYVHQPGIPTP